MLVHYRSEEPLLLSRTQVAESEIQTLKLNLANEKTRTMELEKELESLRASYTCANVDSTNVTSAQIDRDAHIDIADVPGDTETSSSVEVVKITLSSELHLVDRYMNCVDLFIRIRVDKYSLLLLYADRGKVTFSSCWQR